MENGLGDAGNEMFDVVLEEDGFCWGLDRERSDVVPEVLEVIEEVVVAEGGRVIDRQSDVELHTAAVVPHGGVIRKD
jgi:hypothetical protein